MELICINCPRGCHLTVEKINDEVIVKGNACARGITYGKNEVLNPLRTLTTTIKIDDDYLPVITSSPIPKDIIEKRVIKQLVDNDNIVIAVGGGGIPVVKEDKIKLLEGVEAVIDKDRSASLLAKELGADILLILTAIDKVYINFNKENQKALDTLTVEEAEKYIKEDEFAKGSMLPKIEACIDFVKGDSSKKAIIGSLEKASDAIKGNSGTVIIDK